MTKRYELTEAAMEVQSLRAIIEEMDAELTRLRTALKAIAASPDGVGVLRHLAKRAVEGAANG